MNQTTPFDITIIGAGPAGSTLARLLGKYFRIALLDRRTFSASQPLSLNKCCGGLLAPDAQAMLARLGLGVPDEVLASPQLFSVRTIDLPSGLEQYYQRHYLNVDRERFDSWLLSLVPDTVTQIKDALFQTALVEKELVKVQYAQQGKTKNIYTRYLIGADGANSLVRKLIKSPLPGPEKYMAFQEWFPATTPLPYFAALFDQTLTDFYGWLIPKNDKLIVGGAFRAENDSQQKFFQMKKKLLKFGFELKTPLYREGAWVERPMKSDQICLGEGPILLIGEAAGWISPSSAEGFSYAMSSALALAKAFRHSLDFVALQKQYHHHTRPLSKNIWIKNRKSPLMYRPSLRKFILRSGLKGLKLEKI